MHVHKGDFIETDRMEKTINVFIFIRLVYVDLCI